MIVKIADNIISPLGVTTKDNYTKVLDNCTKLQLHEGLWDIEEPFVASLFAEGEIDSLFATLTSTFPRPYTDFEKICISSASMALKECQLDASSPEVVFVISTTKGNVELLNSNPCELPSERLYLGVAAKIISNYFGNPNTPVVVSNACTSGACAQLVAKRYLEFGHYKYAVVIGADVQSKFIVSGFQSFKALSLDLCAPFDKNRIGLNLGEAASTLIFQYTEEVASNQWLLETGAIRNDANHISGPSRTGEGSYRCLKYVLENEEVDEIAFINVHGTATLYNDEMESIAIDRAGLSAVPVNGLKGYYGHTMGAAGLLETILSQAAIEDHTILPTKGFNELGVSRAINVSKVKRHTEKQNFIKLLSGFGGCNVALLYKLGGTR